MDVCIVGILAFLYVTILLHLIAIDLRRENRSFCLNSICVRCVRYILYGQELKANELNSLGTDESQKLHEISLEEPLNNDLRKPSTALTIICHSTANNYTSTDFQNASSETAGLEIPMDQLSGENQSTVSSGPEPIASTPTETNTDSFLQDASSETSGHQKPIGQLSMVNPSTVSYESEQKTNLDKVLPSVTLTNTSHSTETNNTFSFLEDASSEISSLHESIGQLYKMNPTTMSSGSERITSCSIETNTDPLHQDTSSPTTGIQKPVGELSEVNLLPVSYEPEPKTNPDTKVSPSISFTYTSYSTETNNTFSFLEDASSEISGLHESIYQLHKMNPTTFSSGSEPITSYSIEVNTDSFLQDTSSDTISIQKPVGELSEVNPSTVSSGPEPITSVTSDTNTDSFLQDASSHTTGIQKLIGQLSGLNSSPISSDPEHITSCSTEANTDCISPDVHSETDFDRLFLRPETSMALTTIETTKGFEISVCELSESDLQKHSVMDGILPIWWTTDKESHSESEEFVQCSLNEFKSTDYSISDYSCDITLESSDHDGTLRTLALRNEKPSIQLTEVEKFAAFNID